MCFSPYLGVGSIRGDGSAKGLVHTLLKQIFNLTQEKIQVFESSVFDIVTTHNDHPRYVKHLLGRIHVFFTLFGYWIGAWGIGMKTCSCTLDRSKIEVFQM